jgi:nitroreductase
VTEQMLSERFTTEVIEAMATCRAMRYFTDEPVADELIEAVVRAATYAPSPANSQAWEFIVVRDRALKQQLSDLFLPPLAAAWSEEDLHPDTPDSPMRRGVLNLAATLPDVPVVIFVAGIPSYPPHAPDEHYVWSTLDPAAQNLVLAARSLGLGTTYTQFQGIDEAATKKLLGLPDAARIATTIPLGWPAKPFGPVRRKPVTDVLHWDTYRSSEKGSSAP